jgi:NAD(P)-dependent dehydrogenase (short-subunit alcohol dehydrogenase family)
MSKHIIITGGSSGIGLAIVKRLLNQGHVVFNLDVQQSAFGQYIPCDMTDHDAVISKINSIGNEHGIDVLICNAGKHVSANIEQTDEAAFLGLFNLNVKGAFSATQACLPFLKTAGGSIVYVASDQAIIGKRNSFAYNLSKHALASMAKTTALDYASYNIRANALCPGTIDTPLYHNAIERYCRESGEEASVVHEQEAASQPLGRIGQPDEVASFVQYLISDEASFITVLCS